MRATPGIAWAQPNYVYNVATEYVPNDTKFGSQTSLTAIRVSQAWDSLIAAGKPLGNAGTVVAVLDEGVNADQRDFGNAFAVNAADPSNGIDDDGNGFIDDTAGWDFTATTAHQVRRQQPRPDSGKSHGN